jgi:predicted PurR-regulated permease PerM
MSTIPRRAPKREMPAPGARDHEHVGRISTQTTIFALIAVALILYEIQWILPPFVIAGLLAYIMTPAIDWASAQSRLPRLFFVLFAFSLFLLFAMLIGYLGIPPLAREMTHVFNDFEAIVRECATHDR